MLALLFALPLSVLVFHGECRAAEQYLTQTHIDSLIDRAFYKLNTADEMAGAGYTIEEAIEYGKHVARRLKRRAEGDPNEKYILWKVSELEGQLYLEETAAREGRVNQRQRSVNYLVGPFNGEIGKQRPNFARVYRICRQMSAVDQAKGEELKYLADDRRTNIAREVVYSLQTALEAGDLDKARRELVYCKRNLDFLGISLNRYGRLAAKVESRISVDAEIAFIDKSIDKVEDMLAQNHLGEAGELIGVMSTRLQSIKKRTIQREWDRRYYRNRRLNKQLERKEDSLVAANREILRTRGIYEAKKFMNTVLAGHGVSERKIGQVDFEILQTAMARGRDESAEESDYAALQGESGEVSVMDNLMAVAKQKARGEASGATTPEVQGVQLTHMGEVRRKRLAVSERVRRARARKRQREEKKETEEALVEIYTLVEKRRGQQTFDLFVSTRHLLQEHLPKKDFEDLEARVTKAYKRRTRR